MAYITPSTRVYLLQGCPLDKDYNHTLHFSTPKEQENYFTKPKPSGGLVIRTFVAQTYQRVDKGVIRLRVKADEIDSCNYIVFKNDGDFGGKFYYAFIDKVAEYKSNEVSEINYTIDPLQTYYFDYELGECFVEREHTETDGMGEHTVPEDIDCGELVVSKLDKQTYPANASDPTYNNKFTLLTYYVPNISMLSSYTEGNLTTPATFSVISHSKDDNGTAVDGLYTGCKIFKFNYDLTKYSDASLAASIDNLVKTLIESKATIIKFIQVPSAFLDDSTTNFVIEAQPNSFKGISIKDYGNVKNNKLFCSPYQKIIISNNDGIKGELKWELSEAAINALGTMTMQLNLSSFPLISPQVMIYPMYYRGLVHDYESGVTLSNFYEAPWSEDQFARWWATNKEAFTTSLISSSITALTAMTGAAATGGASAAAAGANTGASLVGRVANSISSLKTVQNTPEQFMGQVSSEQIRMKQNRFGFYIYLMTIRAERAKIIDDYFTMFGYKINQLKIPNVRNPKAKLRPFWNYIKTNGCVIHAASDKGLPADAEKKIAEIYDKGITFWNGGSTVGHYELDNRPRP